MHRMRPSHRRLITYYNFLLAEPYSNYLADSLKIGETTVLQYVYVVGVGIWASPDLDPGRAHYVPSECLRRVAARSLY